MPNGREQYTPGHDESVLDFMATRRAATHAGFFLPYLVSGLSVLDIGCGPGAITVGLAGVANPGEVVGVDASAAQLDRARVLATAEGLETIRFEEASCYQVPLGNESVDRVFSHALFEHLAQPETALAEAERVLTPGGIIGLCSPDWGGFLVTPPSADLDVALASYVSLQQSNGGDPFVGRQLGVYLERAGFRDVRVTARYERYLNPLLIARYLARQLDDAGHRVHSQTMRGWASEPGAMFAQAWVSATARRR